MEWSNAQVLALIDLYHNRPVLWDCRLREYKDRKQRHAALMEITVALDLTKDEIERKIKNLQSHFSRECKKVKGRSAVGAGYVCKWFCYEQMQFLMERGKSKNSASAEDQQGSGASEGIESFTYGIKNKRQILEQAPQPETAAARRAFPSPKKCAAPRRARAPIRGGMPRKRRGRDEYDVFGEQIGMKIRKLSTLPARIFVQHLINNTLFEAEMGKYDSPPALMYPGTSHRGHSQPSAYVPFPILYGRMLPSTATPSPGASLGDSNFQKRPNAFLFEDTPNTGCNAKAEISDTESTEKYSWGV